MQSRSDSCRRNICTFQVIHQRGKQRGVQCRKGHGRRTLSERPIQQQKQCLPAHLSLQWMPRGYAGSFGLVNQTNGNTIIDGMTLKECRNRSGLGMGCQGSVDRVPATTSAPSARENGQGVLSADPPESPAPPPSPDPSNPPQKLTMGSIQTTSQAISDEI